MAQIAVSEAEFQDWIAHPMTQVFRKALLKTRETIKEDLVVNAASAESRWEQEQLLTSLAVRCEVLKAVAEMSVEDLNDAISYAHK